MVDDQPHNRDLLRRLLQPMGIEVLQARTGSEAVALFRDTGVNTVVMDVAMPEMNGIEATRQIRQIADGSDVAIIGLSNRGRPDQDEDMVQAGADAIVAKPIQFDLLLKTIARHSQIEFLLEGGGKSVKAATDDTP